MSARCHPTATHSPSSAAAWPIGRCWRCGILVGISSLGVVVFGVWLAIYLHSYHPWDGWVLGSLGLWAVGTGAGQRSGAYYQRAATAGTEAAALRRTGLQLQVLATAAVLLILILMIYKPGA